MTVTALVNVRFDPKKSTIFILVLTNGTKADTADSFYVVPFVFHLKFADPEGIFEDYLKTFLIGCINGLTLLSSGYFTLTPRKKRRSRLTGHSNDQTQKIIEIVVHMCCVVYILHIYAT